MPAYILRRLLQMIPLLLGITVVLFGVIQAAPGGPEAALLESDRFIDPEVIEAYRERLGVDQPIPVQYVKWLTAALRGDLGISFSTTRPVSPSLRTINRSQFRSSNLDTGPRTRSSSSTNRIDG